MYAQIKYPQRLGTGPGAVSIASAGCFVTSFSNLLERFGIAQNPAALNQFFIDHGTYIAESDGTRDLLAFSSIAAFDGNVRITSQGNGSPTEDNSIVKFVYGGGKTHFCLVASAGLGTIVDSWDGVVKSWNAYGGPVAFASYTNAAAQPGTTAKASQRYAVVETYSPARKVRLNKQPTHLWGMNYAFDYMKDHPVETHNAGEICDVTNRVHHEDGMDYYRREGQIDGFNVADCDNYEAPAPAPEIPPTPPAPPVFPPIDPKAFIENTVDGIRYTAFDGHPKPMYISRLDGAEKLSFKNVKNWREFKSVEHFDYGAKVFVVGVALHPIPPNGATFYMLDPDFGDFKRTGKVTNQCGFNVADLSDTKPPALPPPVEKPTSVPEKSAPVVSAPDNSWMNSYQPYDKPLHYVAARDQVVKDLESEQPSLPLPRYNPGVNSKRGMVSVYGTVVKDNVDYYRLKTQADILFDYWYCLPKIDPLTRMPTLLLVPEKPPMPISKTTVARDTVVLAKHHIGFNISKILDIIIPKFLKTKK